MPLAKCMYLVALVASYLVAPARITSYLVASYLYRMSKEILNGSDDVFLELYLPITFATVQTLILSTSVKSMMSLSVLGLNCLMATSASSNILLEAMVAGFSPCLSE